MRTMAIDDSCTIRTAICGTLQQLGSVRIEPACDGEGTLSIVFAFAPDVVLPDWNMPKMNDLVDAGRIVDCVAKVGSSQLCSQRIVTQRVG